MAWYSFLKNIFGAESDDSTENAPDLTDGSPRNETLSGRAFKKQLSESPNAVLLDVRTLGEFSGGTISGAQHLDFLSPSFAKGINGLDKEATYFVFCRSGNRSAQACKMMHRIGLDVRNLSGGIGAYPR